MGYMGSCWQEHCWASWQGRLGERDDDVHALLAVRGYYPIVFAALQDYNVWP